MMFKNQKNGEFNESIVRIEKRMLLRRIGAIIAEYDRPVLVRRILKIPVLTTGLL